MLTGTPYSLHLTQPCTREIVLGFEGRVALLEDLSGMKSWIIINCTYSKNYREVDCPPNKDDTRRLDVRWVG